MNLTKNIIRAALGCAVALLVAAPNASANGAKCREPYRLGGAWVGQTEGISYSWVVIPLDPEGRTAAWNCEWNTLNPQFQEIRQLTGAATIGTVVGELKMVNRDTAKGRCTWVNADASGTKTVNLFTMEITMKFTGRTTTVSEAVLKLYLTGPAAAAMGLPDADADFDLIPDDGAVPIIVVPYTDVVAKRITPVP